MRKIKEFVIEQSLLTSALITIAITFGIVAVLGFEAVRFF
jgi:phosphate transport system permease protein